ncbi:Hypothetical protein NCS54_01214200 [Fusarium falciforme]|uniref:Hypothetical protein n=1 Tax=Fusarium falciforme TaxID=195108 RepID=UPI0023017A05|nr:Hypothetical protein NCS54_01214200 [Fusarium falciforme]WAO94553.1 Hypothetical protein NCS54_01214200 [Fusarium falciforme]
MEPSGEGEQARSKDRRHERLESLRCHFEQMKRPTPSQSDLLKKNVEIVKGPRGGENGLSKSAVSRHRQWQDAFRDIYYDSGIIGFYFVAHALSATALTGFVPQFQQWWLTASIPDAFVEHANKLEALDSVTQQLENGTLPAFSAVSRSMKPICTRPLRPAPIPNFCRRANDRARQYRQTLIVRMTKV